SGNGSRANESSRDAKGATRTRHSLGRGLMMFAYGYAGTHTVTPVTKTLRVLAIQGLVACLLIVVNSLDVGAQSASTGALIGTIIDPTGAVLQNAQIALRNQGTGETRTAPSGHDGSYRFSLLPPGEYELTVDAVGFAPVVLRGVLIRITEVT